MLVWVCVAHLWICFCFTFILKAMRGQNDKIDAAKLGKFVFLTPRSVSLRGVA